MNAAHLRTLSERKQVIVSVAIDMSSQVGSLTSDRTTPNSERPWVLGSTTWNVFFSSMLAMTCPIRHLQVPFILPIWVICSYGFRGFSFVIQVI
jgi:hypothetical protein